MLTKRETELLRKMLDIFTMELIVEEYGTYDYEFDELIKLEQKILESLGFTIICKECP